MKRAVPVLRAARHAYRWRSSAAGLAKETPKFADLPPTPPPSSGGGKGVVVALGVAVAAGYGYGLVRSTKDPEFRKKFQTVAPLSSTILSIIAPDEPEPAPKATAAKPKPNERLFEPKASKKQKEETPADSAKDAAAKVSDAAAGAAAAAKSAAHDASDKAADLKQAVSDKAADAKRAASDKATELKQAVSDGKQAASDKASEAKQAASDQVSAVKGKAADAKQAASDKFSEAKQAASDKFSEAKQAVSDKASEAKQAVSDKASEAKQAVSDKATETKQAAADKASKATQAVSNKASQVKDKADAAKQAVSDAVSDARQEASDKATELKQAAEDKSAEAQSSASEAAAAAKATVSETSSQVKEAVSDAVNAVSDKASEAENAAANVADAAGEKAAEVEKAVSDATQSASQRAAEVKQAVSDAIAAAVGSDSPDEHASPSGDTDEPEAKQPAGPATFVATDAPADGGSTPADTEQGAPVVDEETARRLVAAQERIRQLEEELKTNAVALEQNYEAQRRLLRIHLEEETARLRDHFTKVLEAAKKRMEQEKERAAQAARQDERKICEEEGRLKLNQQARELVAASEADLNLRIGSERAQNVAEVERLFVKLKAIETVLRSHQDAEAQIRRTHKLLIASDKPSTSTPAALQTQLAALKKAAESDEFLKVIFDAVPKAAFSKGVRSTEDLQSRFQSIKPKVQQVAWVKSESGGFWSHLISATLAKVTVEQKGYVKGDDVSAVLARTEHFLEQGDVDMATRELNQLAGQPRQMAESWLADARQHLEVMQALDAARAYVATVGLSMFGDK